MAVINGLYIHVTEESLSSDVDGTSHPVESGIPLTDTVKASALSISLSGLIVDYGNKKAADVIAQLKKWQKSGYLIEYRGRNVASSMQIRGFESNYTNKVNGGAEFSMELIQVRIAKSAYVPKKTSTKKKETAAKTTVVEIKVGSIVVFKGGSVYVSSDAKKASATRSRSTCKVTKISTKSYSVHQYHLISTDGKKVYGWVDKANIEGTTSTSTSGKTNAGTQQVTTGSKKAVYHTVKKGDTVWALVNKSYKNLGKTTKWVIDNNPKCFSKKGDATTLKIGSKLLMGYK